jgi:hypothetical protein
MKKIKQIFLWALPGVTLLILTIPISGEAELTLGVAGIFTTFAGLIVAIFKKA